jgi:hypothetical protein
VKDELWRVKSYVSIYTTMIRLILA